MTNTDVATAATPSALPIIRRLSNTGSAIRGVCGSYARLIRFQYHTSFVSVVAGAILFAPHRTWELVLQLPFLYLSFNVLLYGGIYTINAIADLESDASHPLKRNRPLPSGCISINSATGWALFLIASGLASGLLLFGWPILYVYLAALALNSLYSFIAREIPFIDLVINASTHPLRFLLGVLLVDGRVPQMLLGGVFLVALGFSSARRRIEKEQSGWQARSTLKSYSGVSLRGVEAAALVALLILSILDRSVPRPYYAVMIAVYLLLVCGLDYLGPLRRVFVRVWTQ